MKNDLLKTIIKEAAAVKAQMKSYLITVSQLHI
jgi:hypothetical protein